MHWWGLQGGGGGRDGRVYVFSEKKKVAKWSEKGQI